MVKTEIRNIEKKYFTAKKIFQRKFIYIFLKVQIVYIALFGMYVYGNRAN